MNELRDTLEVITLVIVGFVALFTIFSLKLFRDSQKNLDNFEKEN